MQTTPVRWTIADLELFAGDSRSETLRERRNRYEIIDVRIIRDQITSQGASSSMH